jgi:threonine aldolase
MCADIDLYSDTVTKPPIAMKQAMMEAFLGDEQLGEDPTTAKLEVDTARLLGKSAAMFFPSATMCNQIAISLFCRPGDEVIGAEQSHVFSSENGGIAYHARAQIRAIPTTKGIFSHEELKRSIRLINKAHIPKSTLVVIENTMNAGGGTVWPLDYLNDVLSMAKEYNLKTHLDGARLFNAAIASKTDVKTLAHNFDSITICFSKGLACPMGAILAFDSSYWNEVRRLKQLFGGAMRQSGILAAACLYALDNHMDQLKLDHAHAQRLAMLLNRIDGIKVENAPVSSNMVFFSINKTNLNSQDFLASCIKSGLRFSLVAPNRFRAVTHYHIKDEHIEETGNIISRLLEKS